MKLLLPTTLIAVAAFCTHAEAGLFSFCQSHCGENTERCCVPECKTVKVKKNCWKTECDEVVIPPVCIPSCLDILKNMRPGNSFCGSGSCGQGDCCEVGCTTTSSPCCLPTKSCGEGLLARLFSKHAKCGSRVVTKLKSDSYECEETEVEWKVGHRLSGCTECGDHCTN